MREPTLLQLGFGAQRLLAAGELVDVVRGECEEVCYAWSDFVEKSLLGVAEGRFGEELEVLHWNGQKAAFRGEIEDVDSPLSYAGLCRGGGNH